MSRDARPARILLSHGAGGRAMRRLISEVLLDPRPGPDDVVGPAALDDGAALRLPDGRCLVLTTDAHVVKPAFFPGGDIGRLAVCGVVNDLAAMGATQALALTAAVVLEEGFLRADLERVQASMRAACDEAGVRVVTGDTKVMGKGELDGIVITTTGVALCDRVVTDAGLAPGDRLIVSGTVGDHGFALLALRHGLEVGAALRSDVAPLGGLVRAALEAGGAGVVAMKDPTRGGLAGALHEMASKARVGVELEERSVPVRREARALSELVGIDPLVVASEGKAVLGVRPEVALAVLAALRAHPLGRDAAIVGRCVAEHPGQVVLDTGVGRRLLVEPEGEPLPRIC